MIDQAEFRAGADGLAILMVAAGPTHAPTLLHAHPHPRHPRPRPHPRRRTRPPPSSLSPSPPPLSTALGECLSLSVGDRGVRALACATGSFAILGAAASSLARACLLSYRVCVYVCTRSLPTPDALPRTLYSPRRTHLVPIHPRSQIPRPCSSSLPTASSMLSTYGPSK